MISSCEVGQANIGSHVGIVVLVVFAQQIVDSPSIFIFGVPQAWGVIVGQCEFQSNIWITVLNRNPLNGLTIISILNMKSLSFSPWS